MGFGRSPVPEGALPVFSVETEEEAKRLIVMTCPTDHAGRHYARELAVEQTLANLYAFGDRLRKGYAFMRRKRKGR